MLSSLEPLEERFRQVEEESERRAMQDQEQWADKLVDPATSFNRRLHRRKRSSVSVSRFGQPSESHSISSSTSPTPSSTLASVAQKSSFYHSLSNPRSMDSFISEGSEDESHHLEDDQHVTEVEQIGGGRQFFQKRVNAILPRRMSRSHSHNVLSPSTHMVIGVSVEQATVDATHTHPDGTHTTIQATRSRASTLSAQAQKSPVNGLVQRAKTFARKLGRKRKPRDEEASGVCPE